MTAEEFNNIMKTTIDFRLVDSLHGHQKPHKIMALVIYMKILPHIQEVEFIVKAQSHPPPKWQVEEAHVLTDKASSMPIPFKPGRAS